MKEGESIFWILAEKPMATMESLNSKYMKIHFSFGSFTAPVELSERANHVKRVACLN